MIPDFYFVPGDQAQIFTKCKIEQKKSKIEIHPNLDLGAVNLGVYLDLVANSLLTKNLLKKSNEFRRFEPIWRPRFRRRFFREIDLKNA